MPQAGKCAPGGLFSSLPLDKLVKGTTPEPSSSQQGVLQGAVDPGSEFKYRANLVVTSENFQATALAVGTGVCPEGTAEKRQREVLSIEAVSTEMRSVLQSLPSIRQGCFLLNQERALHLHPSLHWAQLCHPELL